PGSVASVASGTPFRSRMPCPTWASDGDGVAIVSAHAASHAVTTVFVRLMVFLLSSDENAHVTPHAERRDGGTLQPDQTTRTVPALPEPAWAEPSCASPSRRAPSLKGSDPYRSETRGCPGSAAPRQARLRRSAGP